MFCVSVPASVSVCWSICPVSLAVRQNNWAQALVWTFYSSLRLCTAWLSCRLLTRFFSGREKTVLWSGSKRRRQQRGDKDEKRQTGWNTNIGEGRGRRAVFEFKDHFFFSPIIASHCRTSNWCAHWSLSRTEIALALVLTGFPLSSGLNLTIPGLRTELDLTQAVLTAAPQIEKEAKWKRRVKVWRMAYPRIGGRV